MLLKSDARGCRRGCSLISRSGGRNSQQCFWCDQSSRQHEALITGPRSRARSGHWESREIGFAAARSPLQSLGQFCKQEKGIELWPKKQSRQWGRLITLADLRRMLPLEVSTLVFGRKPNTNNYQINHRKMKPHNLSLFTAAHWTCLSLLVVALIDWEIDKRWPTPLLINIDPF